MNLVNKIKTFVNGGAERTAKIKKNIFAMFLIKGGSILISLLLVPLTLNYVDTETYGIWLTLSSMVTWVHFFDVGINNGLKNKLTQAFANNDLLMAKKYVSTTYAILSLIFIPISILIVAAAPFINWASLLNLSPQSAEGIASVVCILISYFCLNFVLSTINIVLQADQRPADASFRQFMQQLISLIIIYVLTLTTQGSLLYLCIGLCVSPLLVITFYTITLYSGRYKAISPSLKSVDCKVAPSLLKLGVMFFICQIAMLIQTQMASFLIIRYYGAVEVTNYNIANRYFGIILMVWGILVTPIWAAVTDAVTKKDYSWIKKLITKFTKLSVLFATASIVMLLVSGPAYNIWVGDKVAIPFWLSFWVMMGTVVRMSGNLYVQILNGAGILKVQTIICLISPIIFIGSFVWMAKAGIGVYSVVIASILANFNSYIVAPIQCARLVNNKYKS